MARNGVKRHKKSESKESRAVDWGGKIKGPLSLDFLFFWPLSPTAELGPRLECLKPLRTSTWEADFHRKYSPNKCRNNDTYGKEGDNYAYFGVSYQSLLRSQLQLELTRFKFLTQQKVTAFFVSIPGFRFKFVVCYFFLLKDLYKSCCCTFIVTPFHLRLAF